MDAKKKRERSLFRDLFIVICLCIPFVIVALVKAVISLVRKVSAYLQSEWERFNGIFFGDRREAEQQSDPALIVHIKGEGPVPGEKCPQTTAKIVESRRFKKTTQQTNEAAYNRKEQKHTSTSKQQKVGLIKIQTPPPPVEKTFKNANERRAENFASTRPFLGAQQNVASKHNNVTSRKDTFVSKEVKRRTKFYLHCLRASSALVNTLLLVPRKVCTYVQCVLEGYSDIHGDGGEDLPYTEPAFIAYLKGEEGAPFIDNPHIRFSRSASRNLKDVSADSEIIKKGNQRHDQKENLKSKLSPYARRAIKTVVNTVLFVPQKVKTYVQCLLEDLNDIHGDSMSGLPHTEPAFIACLKGEEGAPFLDNPHVKFSKSGSTKLENVSENSAIVERETQRQGQNRKVIEGVLFVRLVKGLYCRIRSVISALISRCRRLSFRARVNGTISQEISSYYNVSKERNEDKARTIDRSLYQAEKLRETITTHSGSIRSSPAHVVSTEQGRLFKCFGLSRTAQNLHTSPITGMDTKPKLFSSSPQQVGFRKKQWNVSPTVGKRSQTQVKFPNNRKVDSAATTPVPLRPTEEKPNRTKVPPCVNSSSHVDVSAPNLRNTGMYTGPNLFSVPKHWNTPPKINKLEEKPKEIKVTTSINSSANADVSAPTKSNTGVYTGPKLFSVPEFWDTPPTINKHEEKPKETKMTTSINSFAHADVSAPTSSNTGVYTGPKLFSVPEFWNTPPMINKPAEKDVQLSSEGKARRDVLTPPPFDSNEDSAAKTQKCKSKAEKKAKKKAALEVISRAHVDVPAPAEEKAKREDIPRLIQTACNYLLGCVRTHVQEEKSPTVAHSTQMSSADVCSDLQVLKSQNIEKPLIKKQIDVDSMVSRGKRTKKEEDGDKESWHAQASIGRKESPKSECRNAKRKAERSTCINLKSAPLLTASRRQRYRVNEQNQETVTSMLSEPMDVAESPPETPFTGPPEPMETGGEQYAVVFPLLGETNQPPVNRSFVEEEEPMEIECDESEPMEIDPEPSESEAMETNQGSFLDEFSFAWENIMQTFFNQPDEEMMEIDTASVPATPCTAQLEEIMESMQEPAVIPMPFGKFNSFQWPLITSMKTSGTTFAVPQKATVEINQELANTCKPMETPSGYLCNGDRPLAFTVEVPKDTIVTVRTPAADQAVIEPVMKPVMASPLTDPGQVTSPPLVETETQLSGEPSAPIYSEPLQSLEDKINNELAAKQSVIEPIIKPDMEPLLIERVPSPPLEETETQSSSKPSANSYSEHLQRMEEKLNNEPNTAAIEQQNLVAVETEEETPATQLTMEQLQLMPELGYFPDGLDSDSDEDSDEEYELDFATIDQFLELDAEPEHVDLINQLLTKKELASELE